MNVLNCVGLSKAYGKKTVLEDVMLSLAPGRILGLLGPNGAGKSTLLKLITGLIWPSAGHVEVNGYNVHTEHGMALRKLGAIIEWPNFLPDLSARQNLMILSGGHGEHYRKRLKEITGFVNIDYALGTKVRTFSTGMKQRLGIALALLPDSEFVILDEPTNGLDPAGIVEIRQIIRAFNREYGTTVIVSSHLLGEIEQISDDIAILQHGRLIAHGALHELLRQAAELEIGCDRPQEAAALLGQAAGEEFSELAAVEIDAEGTLLVRIQGDAELLAPRINAFLVNRHFSVRHLALRHYSLEDYFLAELDRNGGASCCE